MENETKTNNDYNTENISNNIQYDRRKDDRRKGERRKADRRVANKPEEYYAQRERRKSKNDRRVTIFNRMNIEVTDRRFIK
ncbi:MAG: hypothetical protein SVR08_14850 [Spirochaetota bacterium]|nr:hypothetical protein [Spirochaetota bacterium]